jgi:hypothetical protein
MVREARGTISDVGGKDDALNTGHVVRDNELVRGESVRILKAPRVVAISSKQGGLADRARSLPALFRCNPIKYRLRVVY